MEDNFRKPLYKDYKRQRTHIYLWRDPVFSLERSYKLADKPLVVTGGVLIVLAAYIMYSYIPWLDMSVFRGTSFVIMLCALLLGGELYSRKFLYRFGRFHVEWEHPLEHPDENASDNCERYGDFLKSEENRKAALKSRRAFGVFYAAVIAAVFLFCFLGYGLAYARAYGWHRGEIEEAARIGQKYDSLLVSYWNVDIYVEGKAADGSEISAEDESALKQIYGSLRWDYVSSMGFERSGSTKFIIELSGAFIHSYLVRYKDIADISQVKKDCPDREVMQLDEHWWHVR